MADNNVERRGDSGASTTWILAVVAVIAVAALIWWLAVNAQPTQIEVAEETGADSAAAAQDAGVPVLTLSDFAANTDSLQGHTIRMNGLQVASTLGTQAFWIQLPNSVPFLVKLDSAAVAKGAPLGSGARVSLTGTVHAMSDSVLSAWQQSGAIQGSQKDEASFASAFIEAHRAQVKAGNPQGGAPQQE